MHSIILFKYRHKFVLLIFTLLVYSQINSQELFGIDFNNHWDDAKKYQPIGKSYLFNQNVLLTPIKDLKTNNNFKYEFMFYNLYGISNVISYYNLINDSITSKYGVPKFKNEKNKFKDLTTNSFFYKINTKEIQYYTKWEKSDKNYFSIESEIRADGNIYVTLTDSIRLKSRSEIIAFEENRRRVVYNKEIEELKAYENERLKIEEENRRIENEKEIEIQKKIQKEGLLVANKYSKQGIAILEYKAIDMSEHTDGTGFRIKFFNPSKKTIKYINISFYGINPVNDKVLNKFGGSYINNVRCVGPIKQYEESEFEWDYIWFTDIVERIKLISIKVQYMDGTIKNITEIKNILVNEDEKLFLSMLNID
jgi:hypothetical protein